MTRPQSPTKDLHIVDRLIEERAGRLARNPLLWGLIRTLLYPLLGYPKAIDMADALCSLEGRQALQHVTDLLELHLEVTGIKHIPASGACVVVANHPSGIADGIALHDALSHRRDDLMLFANRDALRVAPGLRDVVIPVEWVREKRTRERTRETIDAMRQAFADARAVILFPSGRIAARHGQQIVEHPWEPTAVTLARKYDAPIVPVHIRSRASALFYLFRRVSDELRDITVFHEILSKKGASMGLTIGAPIPAAALRGKAVDAVAELQRFVEQDLSRGKASIST